MDKLNQEFQELLMRYYHSGGNSQELVEEFAWRRVREREKAREILVKYRLCSPFSTHGIYDDRYQFMKKIYYSENKEVVVDSIRKEWKSPFRKELMNLGYLEEIYEIPDSRLLKHRRVRMTKRGITAFEKATSELFRAGLQTQGV